MGIRKGALNERLIDIFNYLLIRNLLADAKA